MGRWIAEECGKIVDDTSAFLGRANGDDEACALCEIHNADCAAYEARITELETMLAGEVADNARLRTREVGDEVGNVLCELAGANNRIAELEALSSTKLASEIIVKMEADIQALRAELARVKDESLRVVEDGEACEHEHTTNTMGIIDGHIGFKDIDSDWWLAPDWKEYTPETFNREFTLIRLEHWRTEE